MTEEYKPALDMAYRARHPWVAQIVFERALPNEGDRFDLYISILRDIDIGYTPDRSAFRECIRARNLRELFSDPLMVGEMCIRDSRLCKEHHALDPFEQRQHHQ